MPRLRLTTVPGSPIIVDRPGGGRWPLPRPQFRCAAWLPNHRFPHDAIIDTGSPYTWFGRDVWTAFKPGTDFEWLPFPAGAVRPTARTAGWSFQFHLARLLAPIRLTDGRVELARAGVVVQFADGNPPARGNASQFFVVGLWGGLLDDTKLHITPNPQTGSVDGALEF